MLKRAAPTERQIKNRQAMLGEFRELTPVSGEFWGLEPGNGKTGRTNALGETILVWNLPPVVTCPGATQCLSYCYNADIRKDVFPIAKWCINWYWVTKREKDTRKRLDLSIKYCQNPVIRLHSSGDFFSAQYVKFWKSLVLNNPQALFWGYTKSWRAPEIRNELEALKRLNNIQLIASVDSINEAPRGWRFCLVGDEIRHENLLNCQEQYLGGLPCSDCRICYTDNNKNIYFTKH